MAPGQIPLGAGVYQCRDTQVTYRHTKPHKATTERTPHVTVQVNFLVCNLKPHLTKRETLKWEFNSYRNILEVA